MEDLINKIEREKLPSHVAIIMDGNGRWAKARGKIRVYGHKNGVKSVREVSEIAAEIGIKYLTLYAFSTENWNRPKLEVNALMGLLIETIKNEVETLMENDIRLAAIGNIEELPVKTHKALRNAIEKTSNNRRMQLTLALNYSARREISLALQEITTLYSEGKLKPGELNDAMIAEHLSTAGIPDPELLIRTSGEQRLSNFLLWQMAYTELYFTETLWPDFEKKDFLNAILEFQGRERRFGKTSAQLKSS